MTRVGSNAPLIRQYHHVPAIQLRPTRYRILDNRYLNISRIMGPTNLEPGGAGASMNALSNDLIPWEGSTGTVRLDTHEHHEMVFI